MPSRNEEPQFEVLWPLGKSAVARQNAAPRLRDLSGKVIGQLWDHIFRGEVIYPIVRERLSALYPGIKFVDYAEFGNFQGPAGKRVLAELGAKLRQVGCDAVISGVGA